jgi:hypothetical protein
MTFAHVGFEATIDEIVEVNLRPYALSTEFRRYRRQAMLWSGATVVFCILAVASPLWKAGQGIVAFAIALILGTSVGWLSGRAYEHLTKKRVHQQVAEELRGSQTLRCDVELRSSGLWIDQDHVEVLHRWTDVTAVNDTSSGVEIMMRNTILVVRSRAFANPAEREAFIGHARRLASPVDAGRS